MKFYVEMTYATLDDVYPSMFAVLFVLLVLITSTLAQSSITSVLMTKSQTYQVYAGYYLVNVMVCTLISQILYDEPVEAVTFISIVLSVIASLVLSSERYSDKDLLFQELD
jgi:multidrug transporter EmrE-like cation transporter